MPLAVIIRFPPRCFMPANLDLSVISLVRNAESALPKILEQADELRAQISPEASFELLFFDHNSTDNSLSALQLMSRKHAALRIFAHTRMGSAIKRGARCARGSLWIFTDGAPRAGSALWVLDQLRSGQLAAAVDGEVLGITRARGIQALSWHQGGLWAAQRSVQGALNKEKREMTRRGWQSQGAIGQLRLALKGRWSQLHPQLRRDA